ncbi:MAG: hypothetical protein AB6733_24660 [Clostridiaceae bacterium]
MIDKIKKVIFFILLITVVVLVVLPIFPYKRAAALGNSTYLNNKDYIQLKVTALSSGEVKLKDGQAEKLTPFVTDTKHKYVHLDKIMIIGNTHYESLTTFEYGISQYSDFVVIGTFTKEVNSKGYLIFNVTEWYPESGYIPLIDTYFWENNIKTSYSIAVIPTLILAFIQMFYIFKVAVFGMKELDFNEKV